MCTVSVIALKNAFRLVSSRDEQRTRPDAQPPAWRRLPIPGSSSTFRALYPLDQPVAPPADAPPSTHGATSGTWIAASERGLAMSLLNLNLPDPPAPPRRPRSRGEIIPALLHLNSAHAVAAAVHDMDLSPFAPFRLIAAELPTPDDPPVIAEIRWDRGAVASAWHRAPACFASSGLGDHLVQCRLPLFDEMFPPEPDQAAPADPEHAIRNQDAFHAHTWPGRPHLSVLMSRPDARTVSTTAATVSRDPATARATVTMSYHPIADDRTPSPPAPERRG